MHRLGGKNVSRGTALGRFAHESGAFSKLVAGKPLAATADWVPTAPSPANGFAAQADLSNAPTVFGGRWGDSTALDPAAVAGKVVVFLAPPSAPSAAGGRGPASFVSCADVPNKFGAAAAAAVEAAPAGARRPAGAGGRGGGAPADTRAQRAGAAAVFVVGLDDMASTARTAAFDGRMTMQPAASTSTATTAGATISRAAAAAIFGKPIDQLAAGEAGQPVSARWKHEWKLSPYPARNVVAVLPGSDPTRAAEYVLVGAHNDHVGVNATPVDHDSLRAVNTVTRRQGANDPALSLIHISEPTRPY